MKNNNLSKAAEIIANVLCEKIQANNTRIIELDNMGENNQDLLEQTMRLHTAYNVVSDLIN